MRDIFEEMRRMQEDMDRMFDSFFRTRMPLLAVPSSKKGDAAVPAKRSDFRAPVSNIQETDKSVIASFEIPGADRGDIDLNVTDHNIEVRAKRSIEKESKDKDKGYYSYMASSSQYYRSLPLPARVDHDNTVAVYKDGVLRVTMPKLAENKQQGKRVQIK